MTSHPIVVPMPAARDLDSAQRTKLLPVVQRLIAAHGGQKQLSARLKREGVSWSQSAISGFLSGRQGTSFAVALRVCELANEDAYALLGLKRPTAGWAPDPTFRTFLSRLTLIGLHDELIATDKDWRLSTVVRAAMTDWDSPDGKPRGGWRRALESIESGEADRIVGGAPEAVQIGRSRAGKRRPLP